MGVAKAHKEHEKDQETIREETARKSEATAAAKRQAERAKAMLKDNQEKTAAVKVLEDEKTQLQSALASLEEVGREKGARIAALQSAVENLNASLEQNAANAKLYSEHRLAGGRGAAQ